MIRELLLRMRAELPPWTRYDRLEYVMHPVALAGLFDELRDELNQTPVGSDGGIRMFGIPVRKDAARNPEDIELRERAD